MREIDITKQDIRCCDDFDISTYNGNAINITYELWFDVDKYFGTDTRGTNSWINFYTFYHEDGSITATYEIDYDDHTESVDWELTEVEEAFFKGMMQSYCNCLFLIYGKYYGHKPITIEEITRGNSCWLFLFLPAT